MDNIQDLVKLRQNPHFLRFVAILGVPQFIEWRQAHPEVPSVRGTLNRLMKLRKHLPTRSIQQQFLNEFVGMLVWIVQADEHLHYSVEDMDWIIESVSSPDAPLIFSTLFVYASCPIRWFSAEQVATFAGRSPSTWQKRAADGLIVGVEKIGKTWLFSESGLAAAGVTVPPMEREKEEEHEEEA
ncbi:hypothetical protein KSF_109920 [Reticulibacter mediterranei]|uniref:Uncharacterized protein n=1 Tax=Reticulibacter mediterranei TaxID=2778369 RepID=A0A8J3N784_9CHLR|nr:helix-turn-helix domain-containing protein [Reticulibacter mediterranei]GHP00945.1 hypothetical protein KSF_109920 [Reticulibacter mediterranei]